MAIKRIISQIIHSPPMQRVVPERMKELYRRCRDRVLRTSYHPRSYWSRRGRTYMQEFPPATDRHATRIVELLAELRAESLLEAGCGYGRYLKAAAEKLPLSKICGVDISDTQIASARQFLKDFPRIELHIAPATALPLPDASFDTILTYGMLFCLRPDDFEGFLKEACRVGRRWGIFIEPSINRDQPHLNPHYYFAHDYPDAFRRYGMELLRSIVLNEPKNEVLYLVRLHPEST